MKKLQSRQLRKGTVRSVCVSRSEKKRSQIINNKEKERKAKKRRRKNTNRVKYYLSSNHHLIPNFVLCNLVNIYFMSHFWHFLCLRIIWCCVAAFILSFFFFRSCCWDYRWFRSASSFTSRRYSIRDGLAEILTAKSHVSYVRTMRQFGWMRRLATII